MGHGNRSPFRGTVTGISGITSYLLDNGSRLSEPLPCYLNSVKGRLDLDNVTDFGGTTTTTTRIGGDSCGTVPVNSEYAVVAWGRSVASGAIGNVLARAGIQAGNSEHVEQKSLIFLPLGR